MQGWELEDNTYIAYAKEYDGLVNSSQTQRTFTVATPTWTDSTLSGVPIKAAHINELRNCVDNIYAYYGLTAPTWTDTITSGVHIKAVHITELRAAIEAVRAYVNGFDSGTSKDISAFTRTDSTLTNKRIKAVHITEIRSAITKL